MSDDRDGRNSPTTDPGEGARWVRCHKPGWQTASGLDGWRWEPVDLGVADIVERLQGEDKPFTVGACDGHDRGLPEIMLADGRTLVVHPARTDRMPDQLSVSDVDRTQTCANCGESWGSAECHIGIGEGEWCCSAWCEECHEDEGCPLEIGKGEVEHRRERRMDRELGLSGRNGGDR